MFSLSSGATLDADIEYDELNHEKGEQIDDYSHLFLPQIVVIILYGIFQVEIFFQDEFDKCRSYGLFRL